MDIASIKEQHKLLKKWEYNWTPLDKGYTDKILHINVGTPAITEKDVPAVMKEKFIGGKGYGLRLLWDATKPDTKWYDPENEIIISSGPIGGITQYSGTGKSLVVTISPQTDSVMDSNVGGFFGPFLKFSGFDAIELQGKSEKDVIIYIDGINHTVEIFEAPGEATDSHVLAEQLTDLFAENENEKKSIGVVSAGSAAEHSLIGMLNFSFYDLKRKKVRLKQAGRGGIGTVFRNKKIKALVCKIPGVKGNLNNVVDLDAIMERGKRFNREMRELDDKQCQMRQTGTAHLMEIMNDHDLLPVMNYKYGSHPDAFKIDSSVWKSHFTQNIPDGCWIGCNMSCSKGIDDYIVKTGPYIGKKVIVDGPEYENAAGLGANCAIFDPGYIIETNFYCDTYGICTITWSTLTAFIMECYQNGILNKERTGGLELNFGNSEAALEMLHQLARGEGFGKIAGTGVRKMKELFIKNGWGDEAFLNDIGMENKGLEYSQYMPKESLAQQGGFALTNKGPQHDEAWLIFMDMVNNQIPSFENKAEALHYFPMFRTWFGLVGLCKLPWNDVEPETNAQSDEPAKVPEHVDNYVTIYKAVTGREFDKYRMIEDSERVYNFQRVFNLRRGYGKRVNDNQPYRAAGPVTKEEYESRAERYDKQLQEQVGFNTAGKATEDKMKVLRKYREDQYERLRDAVYRRRGWNNNGVPTIAHLKKIGMDFPEVIDVVKIISNQLMQSYISFLRGVNMTGHNSIKMADLAKLYFDIGFIDIQTYIQSGNVIFGASNETPVPEIEQRIEMEILSRFNFVIPAMVRTIKEVSLLTTRNPFLNEEKFDPSKMAVIFLHETPSDTQINKVININYPPDKFLISGKEIFIYCPDGFGKTKIYTNFFEKKMGVSGTARNWKTITSILQIAEKQMM